MSEKLLLDVLIIFLFSIPVIIIFKKTKLPTIIGFLVIGLIIGPFGFNLIKEISRIEILAEIGISLLLFSVGLEFSLESLKRFRTKIILGGILQIGLLILVIYSLCKLLGWKNYHAIYLGCIVSLSSTAVVLTTLVQQKRIDSFPARISTGLLILQDLSLIPMILLLQYFGDGKTDTFSFYELSVVIAKAVLLISLIVFSIKYFIADFLNFILSLRSRELFVFTLILLAIGMSWLTHNMGLSFALGAFLGGFMIGTTDYKYQALSDVLPFRYAFNSLFFVSIGMMINLSFISKYIWAILVLVIGIFILKFFVITLTNVLFRVPIRLSLTVGLYLSQIGEFSFLLAYIGRKNHMVNPYLYDLSISITVILFLITPFLIRKTPDIVDKIISHPILKKWIKEGHEFKIERKIHDHVIICGFGPLAKTLGIVLEENKIPYLVLDMNPRTVKAINKENKMAIYGDGASEEILNHAGIETAKILAITVPDYLNSRKIIHQARMLNKNIFIITRARYQSEMKHLYQAGADLVISEEAEAGLEMGKFVLKHLDFERNEIQIYIQAMRETLQIQI